MLETSQSIRAVYLRATTNHPRTMQFARFIVSGGTATAANLGILFLLTHFLGFWYLTSSIVAFAFAFCISFALQKVWTFENKSREHVHVQAMLFMAIILLGLGMNTLLIYALVQYAHLHYLIAQLITGIFIAVMNYFSYKNLIFRNTDTQNDVSSGNNPQ